MTTVLLAGRKLQRDYERAYRAAHVDKMREQARLRQARWRAAHPEAQDRSRAAWREWYAAHPGHRYDGWDKARSAALDANAKAVRLGLPGRLSKEQVARLHLLPCGYCGVLPALGIDHVIPFARRGSNTLDNLTPSCMTCNRKKGAA